MEVPLLQIINTKKLRKTASSSRVVVQYVNRKILQFYKESFINLNQMKALETKKIRKIQGKFCKYSLTSKDFLYFFYHFKAFENKEFRKFKLIKSDL